MPELHNAEIDWLDDGTPRAKQFDDVYFSRAGGLAESEHVFLVANRLAQRWEACADKPKTFTIAELGFGTGLNLLLCWRLLDQMRHDNIRLHYVAFEQFPLRLGDLTRALAAWPELETYSKSLSAQYIDHTAGLHRYCLSDRLTLDLYLGDVMDGMQQVLLPASTQVDCWFMDGFAPRCNPAMWSQPLLNLMGHISGNDATVSTYSVAGQVRRNLKAAGFDVSKVPGFGSKREMLTARRSVPEPAPSPSPRIAGRAAWFRVEPTHYPGQTVTVVGAGLAGCSTAYSLARKGWHVTLIDAATDIATGASGNPQAVLQPRLAANAGTLSQFYLHGLLFSNRQFTLLQQRQPIGWHNCGVIRLIGEQRKGLLKLGADPSLFYSGQSVTRLSREQASRRAGLALRSDGLWLPHGGWLEPARLCRAYLNEIPPQRLNLLTGQAVTRVSRQGEQWQVRSDSNVVANSDVVVLANGHAASTLQQTEFVPLTPVAGQLTRVGTTLDSAGLGCVVAADRYICPALEEQHCVGATYTAGESSPRVSLTADQENLAGLGGAFESLDLPAASGSRVGVRCRVKDYLPVVGAVPDLQDFTRVYAALSKDASSPIDAAAASLPGLFINTAHGSYGLASCPITAEYLASLINQEPLPMEANLVDTLSAARFIIRDLKRQNVSGTDRKAL